MKSKKKKLNTLSVLIIVAIIGVLITLLVPTYKIYKRRANYNKIVTIASHYKNFVSQCFEKVHHLDHCALGKHGIPNHLTQKDRRYIKSVDVSKGVIVVIPKTHRGIMEEDTLVYIPSIRQGKLNWTAAGRSVEKGYAN